MFFLLVLFSSMLAKPQLAIVEETGVESYIQVEEPMQKIIKDEIKNPQSMLNKFDYKILEVDKQTNLPQKMEKLNRDGCKIFIGFSRSDLVRRALPFLKKHSDCIPKKTQKLGTGA